MSDLSTCSTPGTIGYHHICNSPNIRSRHYNDHRRVSRRHSSPSYNQPNHPYCSLLDKWPISRIHLWYFHQTIHHFVPPCLLKLTNITRICTPTKLDLLSTYRPTPERHQIKTPKFHSPPIFGNCIRRSHIEGLGYIQDCSDGYNPRGAV